MNLFGRLAVMLVMLEARLARWCSLCSLSMRLLVRLLMVSKYAIFMDFRFLFRRKGSSAPARSKWLQLFPSCAWLGSWLLVGSLFPWLFPRLPSVLPLRAAGLLLRVARVAFAPSTAPSLLRWWLAQVEGAVRLRGGLRRLLVSMRLLRPPVLAWHFPACMTLGRQ